MGVNWSRDIDQTLAAAQEQPAPSCWISARLRREGRALGWMPSRMKIRKLPNSSAKTFFLVKAHIKEHPAWFHRFDAVWTPTVLLLDAASIRHLDRVRSTRVSHLLPLREGK